MIQNPTKQAHVANLPWPCEFASGIRFSNTTYSMAPAANESAYGNNISASPTPSTPRTLASGSTIPLSCPYLLINHVYDFKRSTKSIKYQKAFQ